MTSDQLREALALSQDEIITGGRPIAFCGRMGAGKTTAAQYLVDQFGYTRLPFADRVRDVAELVYGPEARNNRTILIAIGKGMRAIDPDIWVKAWMRRVTEGISFPICVDDMRFPNEYWKLKEQGFVIVRVAALEDVRVSRLLANGKLDDRSQLEDESETALNGYHADHVILNMRDPEDLYEELNRVMYKELSRV